MSKSNRKVGKDFRDGTYKHYVVTYNKVKKFIKSYYKADDFTLESLSHKFVTDFEFYLKTTDGLSNNSAMKKIKQVKKIIRLALALFQLYNLNGFGNPVIINRWQVMEVAKISGAATFHKCIKDLQEFGCIRYLPSYNPVMKSQVYLARV